MRNKQKAAIVACMLVGLLYAVLYCISLFYDGAWRVYGIGFGIIGAIYFYILVYRWIAWEPRQLPAQQNGGQRRV